MHLQCINTLRHVSSPWQGGTGGTIAGVSRYLKQRNPAIKTYLVDPEGSSLYSYVTKVCHRVRALQKTCGKRLFFFTFALAVGLTLCSVHSISRLRLLSGFLFCSVLVFCRALSKRARGRRSQKVCMSLCGWRGLDDTATTPPSPILRRHRHRPHHCQLQGFSARWRLALQ